MMGVTVMILSLKTQPVVVDSEESFSDQDDPFSSDPVVVIFRPFKPELQTLPIRCFNHLKFTYPW